ncbi:MAG: hypothetical protein QM628_00325 [Propionicimonas sp.]
MGFRPAFEGQKCSLGYQVIEWLEENACHGPGDVEGEPLDFRSDPEVEQFIIDCYELDPQTGRRKVKVAVYSAPKGRAKSETAGLVGIAESLAPCVRFDGWDDDGQPMGRPVTSPFIRCLATEEKQAGHTFQNIAFVMGEWGHDTHPDIYGKVKGIGDYRSAQNIYLPNGGECRSSSSGAASKDGGKETFLVPDELHLYVLPELRSMYATAMRNTGKRKKAEPWALPTTTACKLGEQSVWEVIEKLYKQGKLDETWLVHHKEARGRINILDKARTIRQLLDVYGPAMDPDSGWMDPEDVYRLMLDPTVCRDEAEAARYYLNRSMAGSDAWISKTVVEKVETNTGLELVEVDGQKLWMAPAGTAISIGLDGSLNDDSTVIRGCVMDTGHRFTIGIWEKPEGAAGAGWEVPRREVLQRFRWAMSRYVVARAYCDPHEWRTDIDDLGREFNPEDTAKAVVIPWPTSRDTPMAAALDRLRVDITRRDTLQSVDPAVLAHYGNAYQRPKGRLVLVRKEYPNSPRKIDAVVTDALAYEARADAIAAGWSKKVDTRVFHFRR